MKYETGMGIKTGTGKQIISPVSAMVVAIDYRAGKVILAPIPSAFSEYLITIWNIRPYKISRGSRVKSGQNIGVVKTNDCGFNTYVKHNVA